MSTLIGSSLICLATGVLLLNGCSGEKPKAEGVTIKADKKVEMVTNTEGEQKPFFRATLKFKNPDGSDADVKLHEKADALKKSIKIKTAAKKPDITPFYVIAGTQVNNAAAQREVSHDILLLFDVSGSMNYTDLTPSRFAAAQQAAGTLVNGLPASYRVAVVPFESRGVAAKFETVQFRSPQDAAGEINALPRPANDGNTALYSAMDYALEVLNKRKAESQDQSLIVLTDGKNDVGHEHDDRGLLAGDAGFQAVLRKLGDYNIRTFTIGIGRPSQGRNDLNFEEDKLTALAYPQGQNQYFKAENLTELKKRFVAVQESVSKTLTVTFFTDNKDLHDLRFLNFAISYTTPAGKVIKGMIPWNCGSSATCSPVGILRNEERAELDKSGGAKEPDSPVKQILWLFGQFALLSGGIAVLWLFVPNLIWPSVPLPQLPSRGKQKGAPAPAKPSPRAPSPSSSGPPDRPTPSKPRQRFEETRIHDTSQRRDPPSGRE